MTPTPTTYVACDGKRTVAAGITYSAVVTPSRWLQLRDSDRLLGMIGTVAPGPGESLAEAVAATLDYYGWRAVGDLREESGETFRVEIRAVR